MRLYLRRKLPVLVGWTWLIASWYWLLGAPTTLAEFDASWTELRPRWHEIDLAAWIGLLFLAMYAADRLYLVVARRLWGVDPYAVPWWMLRTEDGSPICPRCRGTMFLPPPSLADDDAVTCDSCGRPLTNLADYRLRQTGRPVPDRTV